jgi:hypothetical protein
VAAKIWIGIRSRAAHLRRLSVVFAVELRLKIVTELYMREMSPKQFYEEFGGGSISRVDKNFKKLAEHGWLRYIRTETGGSRRGAKEHFYRATEPAYFNAETWALLPYSIRVAFSWSSFRQIAELVRQAMEVLALEVRSACNLTVAQLQLDQLGWDQVIEAVDAQFVGLFDEQDDAKLRIFHSGEESIRVGILQFAFEAPVPGAERAGPRLVESDKEPLVPFPVRLSKIFADEVCVQIIAEANLREISATQFHAEFGGGSVNSIRQRFKLLQKISWLKKVSQKSGGRRRGATENFYRATGPAIADDNGPWINVPDSLRQTDSWKAFEKLSAQVKEAMVSGTFDAREDRYLAWSLLRLDRRGWEKVTAGNQALLAFVLSEQERAKARMKQSGERPIAMTVAVGAFESPPESVKEP